MHPLSDFFSYIAHFTLVFASYLLLVLILYSTFRRILDFFGILVYWYFGILVFWYFGTSLSFSLGYFCDMFCAFVADLACGY